MCENFGIEVIATPGYSPWSNGTCERYNLILTEILLEHCVRIREIMMCYISLVIKYIIRGQMGKNGKNLVWSLEWKEWLCL